MDRIKKIILLRIPMSICNFRCTYCYLAQRQESFQGIQPEMKFSPIEVANSLSPKRLGGFAYINFCADGETLLVRDIDKYIYELAKQGHYIEIVSNMTVKKVINQICKWPRKLLSHLTFKCSFHYLELKKRNLLDVFAENVHAVWDAGASASIEITPSDDLIPFLEEVKAFSVDAFGALPQLSIARDDRTKEINYLTSLNMEEYDEIWGSFDSSFWKFKKTIFGKKQQQFCYAGAWSVYADLSTGEASQCYCGIKVGNIFENPNSPFPELAIGMCKLPHCYNGHMLLTLGLIPGNNNTYYGEIRDRITEKGNHWMNDEIRFFLDTKLEESNSPYHSIKKGFIFAENVLRRIKNRIKK